MSVNDKDQGSGRGFKISGEPLTEFQSTGLSERDPKAFKMMDERKCIPGIDILGAET